jgi:hypothetical protein
LPTTDWIPVAEIAQSFPFSLSSDLAFTTWISAGSTHVDDDGTRDIPMSGWLQTVNTDNVRIIYLLDADNAFRIDGYVQTASDTAHPDPPTSLGLPQVSGAGAGSLVHGDTVDIDVSSVSAARTPALARIVARISTAGGAAFAARLAVHVEVS